MVVAFILESISHGSLNPKKDQDFEHQIQIARVYRRLSETIRTDVWLFERSAGAVGLRLAF